VKDKNRTNPIDVDADAEDTGPVNARLYDIDADDPVPVDPASEAAGESGETPDAAGDDVPADEAASAERGRSKFSRREILDRFQKKNTAIAQLSKEKTALEKARAELEAQVTEYKDRWLRAAAEFENYRKRSTKEWELLKQQSRAEVILEVLSSLDDFERAFAVVDGTGDSEFIRGIRLIYNNLLASLQKLGVAELESHHQPFDPVRHMAIGQIETTEVPSGRVAEVVEKGYSLDGVVIRPARVIVAK
jgi:molecular chaperone GrpE